MKSDFASIFISNETRKNKYAATWTLMALTRAIDTLYLEIDNKDSEFGKIVEEYIALNPGKVRVIK